MLNPMEIAAHRLLLVEDDEALRKSLLDALRAAGYEVDVAVTVENARWRLEQSYDLCLLDLGLPDGDGLEICRQLRARGDGLPVLILTARDEPSHRVRGLDVGADDYVVKPFYLPELLARIRGVLRRSGRPESGRVSHGPFWIEPSARRAGIDDRELPLTRREFDLWHFLVRHPGRTWSRDQLLSRVWGPEFETEAGRTVDVHVRRLREHVEAEPGRPRWLETVWGVGYRLAEPR